MTESAFKKVFTQFLNSYWGAFHEALEAQSVTPTRLAGSLFQALQSEHRSFEAMYVGSAKNALADLGRIEVEAGDFNGRPGLTQEEMQALRCLGTSPTAWSVRSGFSAAHKDILKTRRTARGSHACRCGALPNQPEDIVAESRHQVTDSQREPI
jgi:hypothetical protein